MRGKKKSTFIEDGSVPESHYFDTFGGGVNRKISKPNLFSQIRDQVAKFIYNTTDELKAANLEADPDNPVFVRLAETNFRLYRITAQAAIGDDIPLNNGTTATFQEEYDRAGFDFFAQTFTATEGQVSFTLTEFQYTTGQDPSNIRVEVNGLHQMSSQITETSSTTFDVVGGVSAGDVVYAATATSLDVGTTTAAEYAELSREWAENPEDDPVVPGGFSSLHWSAKSEGFASAAEGFRNTALIYRNETEGFRDTTLVYRNETQVLRNEAALSAQNAADTYDNFNNRYLGPKASAPTTDNDGDPLLVGALYYHTTAPDEGMKVWDGSAWDDGYTTITINTDAQPIDTTQTGALSVNTYWYADSSAPRTRDLPASPADNDEVPILDNAGQASTNTITIGRNGNTIMGLAEDMTITTDWLRITLKYNGGDWRIVK